MELLSREELNDGFTLTLVRGEDEPAIFSSEFQRELAAVIRGMREAGVRLSPTIFTMDAVDASGGMTGVITVLASTVAAAGAVLGAFLNGRNGRKVRLKMSPTETEVEASTPAELEKLLLMAREHKKADEPTRIING